MMKSCCVSSGSRWSFCLFHSATGCYTGRQYADESASILSPGMTMDEVAAQLGEPDQIVRATRNDTYWIYRYEGGPAPPPSDF